MCIRDSHDLDIRGAGNLVGDEQSGHIKEVGFELYQSMLEEAILEAKSGGSTDFVPRDAYSPQITIDAPVQLLSLIHISEPTRPY